MAGSRKQLATSSANQGLEKRAHTTRKAIQEVLSELEAWSSCRWLPVVRSRCCPAQLEKKKLDEWSEAKVMSMAKAECKKQLWDEYTEMKMEYMAQLEAQKMEKEREREERELKEKEKEKPRRKLRRASIAGMALDAFGRASMDGLEEYLDMIEEDLEGQDDEAARTMQPESCRARPSRGYTARRANRIRLAAASARATMAAGS